MSAAMPCKTPVNCRGETCRSIGKSKTKYACIVDADGTMRIRLEGVPHRYYKDHISAKGIDSLSRYNLVLSSFQCLKHQKYRMQRQHWKNEKILDKILDVQDKQQTQYLLIPR